jgi:hypothetical protein
MAGEGLSDFGLIQPSEQFFDCGLQRRQVIFHDRPDDVWFNTMIFMPDYVADGSDAGPINVRFLVKDVHRNVPHRFRYDLDRALYAPLQKPVFPKIESSPARNCLVDTIDGHKDLPQDHIGSAWHQKALMASRSISLRRSG